MVYKILADIIVILHFLWIVFILAGFALTLYFLFSKDRKFFDLWLLRVVHLCGIVYTCVLTILNKYCPLTLLENILRQKYSPELKYPGSFIIYYIEKLVYPEINPLVIVMPTIIIGVVTLAIFVIVPPIQVKEMFNVLKIKMNLKYAFKILVFSLIFIIIFFARINVKIFNEENINNNFIVKPAKPEYVRGIHLNSWRAGSKKYREKIDKILLERKINTVVIAVKESNGEVYVPQVKTAEEFGAYVRAMPDIEKYLKELREKKIYTVARIVVFKDNISARVKPEWAVKDSSGSIWQDYKKLAWLDPYNKEAWEYIFEIAQRCVTLGFEEIQFDYLRFPSDGIIRNCRYSQVYSSTTAVNTIVEFLSEAKIRLKNRYGVNISADVFGLTTSSEHDMGIGQVLVEMAKHVDFICPMVYPSHYPDGTYGISNPDAQPYRTVYKSINDAVERLGFDYKKLRPYLQDFSLRKKYTVTDVLEQIKALYDNNVFEWTLWNPGANYTFEVFNREEIDVDRYKIVRSSDNITKDIYEKSLSSYNVTESSFCYENSLSSGNPANYPQEK